MSVHVSDLIHFITQRTLSREIAVALLIKVALLWGLWYMAFRHDDINKPLAKPDIADVFRPTKVSTQPHSSIHSTENTYDFR